MANRETKWNCQNLYMLKVPAAEIKINNIFGCWADVTISHCRLRPPLASCRIRSAPFECFECYELVVVGIAIWEISRRKRIFGR